MTKFIPVCCNHCGLKSEISEHYIHRKSHCPKCGAVIISDRGIFTSWSWDVGIVAINPKTKKEGQYGRHEAV